MSKLPQIGAEAPAFALKSHLGEVVDNAALLGGWFVLYFYPRDNTSGCTTEACAFRDLEAEFAALGARILGVSKDSLASHERFAAKQSLNFPLLSDEEGAACEAYGVWQEKKMAGRTYMGIVRSTFIVDPEGIVRKVYPKVRVKGHVDAVLADLRALQ